MIATWLTMIPAQSGDSLWLPEQASTIASTVDDAWWLVYWISVFFFVIILAVQAVFMWKYRRRPGWTEQRTAHHNYPLELTWSILPSLVIIVMFVKGFLGFIDMRTPPANTYDVNVVAAKWSWTFQYPQGISHSELHVPVNTNVKLVMSSNDVIHSLFIDAFRVKQDIVPGRYNYLWFNATKPGTYHLQCTEYCGRNHSDMRTTVVVHDGDGMDQWVEEEIKKILNMPPIELGALLYEQRSCNQCHALDTTTKVGPGFAQTFGEEHKFQGGEAVKADENYIRESIENPQAHVRAGFPGTMPTYKGLLREEEIRGLVAYIKSRNPKYKAEAERQFAKPKTDEQPDGDAETPPSDSAEKDDGATDAEGGDVAPGDRGGEPAGQRE
ncbi:MAG: cytochrome c oxidase subunit II [Planctomycetaceae bacterium]